MRRSLGCRARKTARYAPVCARACVVYEYARRRREAGGAARWVRVGFSSVSPDLRARTRVRNIAWQLLETPAPLHERAPRDGPSCARASSSPGGQVCWASRTSRISHALALVCYAPRRPREGGRWGRPGSAARASARGAGIPRQRDRLVPPVRGTPRVAPPHGYARGRAKPRGAPRFPRTPGPGHTPGSLRRPGYRGGADPGPIPWTGPKTTTAAHRVKDTEINALSGIKKKPLVKSAVNCFPLLT